MEGSILSTYMFGILVLLLIIVIIVMYYLWNETKKNKNTITMLESDMEALRGRLEKNSKHIEQLESFEMPGADGMGNSGPSKLMQQQHILEQLMGGLGMRDFMQTGEDDEEEEYESDEDEDMSGDASGSGEDEESDEEDEDMSGDASGSGSGEESEYETVDEEGKEDGEAEECDACGSHHEEEEESPEVDMEETEHADLPDEPTFVPVITPEMDDRINNLLGELNVDGANNKKFPAKTPSECEVGVVMKGGDSKDYVVSLNKRGGKYWKPLK